MSAQAISHVWDAKGVTAEEKLILLWIANNCAGLGHPASPEWAGMAEFIGGTLYDASDAAHSLVDKGFLLWGGAEDSPQSYLYLAHDGEYFAPVDFTAEAKGRSPRIAALIERDGPQCRYCGSTPVNYHVDHFVPRCRGGADKMHNLVLSCPSCNLEKSGREPSEFLSNRPGLFERILRDLGAPAQ